MYAARLLIWLLISALLSACALTNRLFHNDAAEQHASALLQVQLNVMRYADEYAARIAEPLQQFQNATTNPNDRLAAQNWKVSQATAAYTIAAGPNPQISALDMVVFATLSRMVIDDEWITERFGTRADALRAEHAKMEADAWSGAIDLLSPQQVAELKQLIVNWREKNPHTNAVAYIHFDEFAKSIGQPKPGAPITPGSLFTFLGIDPLSTLDPAVRELTQARQLAERALYFAERTPNLIDMQVERAALQLAVMPESVGLLADISRTSLAAQQAGNLAATLPELLAKERAATIEQVMAALNSNQGKMQALIVDLRSTLEAGTTTSDSLKGTIASFDALMARFDKPDTSTATQPSGKPFDITQYTETARQLGDTARQLETLLNQVDNNVPALAQLSDRTSDRVQSLVDHTFWRLAQLVLLLVAASVVGALGYRVIARRWNRSGG